MKTIGMRAWSLLLILVLLCSCAFAETSGTQVTLYGQSFSADAEEIDLSGTELTDTAELEAALTRFPNLKKVVLCGCGLDNETMDALNSRYDDIRFVWSIAFGPYVVRTDATVFAPCQIDRVLWGDELKNISDLRYLTDLVVIDLGHHGGVTDCEWAAYMPELRYLIIAETGISDLTPLSNCKKLIHLEMWRTYQVTDLSPLIGCTALEDINITNNRCSVEPLLQMPWLRNIWAHLVSGAAATLEGNMPETTYLSLYAENPTDAGWRGLQNYFDMRDLMGMDYLI